MKFSKTQLTHDLTCALCGAGYPESSHDARVDVGCKEVQKTETDERAHAKRAGSAEGGNKAPTKGQSCSEGRRAFRGGSGTASVEGGHGGY